MVDRYQRRKIGEMTGIDIADHPLLSTDHIRQAAHDMPFLGTAEKPLVADLATLSMVQQHAVAHLHSPEGECLKNRFGVPCGSVERDRILAADKDVDPDEDLTKDNTWTLVLQRYAPYGAGLVPSWRWADVEGEMVSLSVGEMGVPEIKSLARSIGALNVALERLFASGVPRQYLRIIQRMEAVSEMRVV